jgi:threonine dehydratase
VADKAATETLSLQEIRAAAERIRPFILPTPTVSGEALGPGDLYLKAENLQRTGSFKIRGAMNAVLQLSDEVRRRGVITLSAGNHGLALAYAARRAGIPCVVVTRKDAPKIKVDAIRQHGAELVFSPIAEWQARLEAEQQRRGLTLVHPFDDPEVVAGQGTVGLEIMEAVPEVRTVVVPVGGGGLISGIAVAVKSRRPAVRIVGVEPTGAAAVSASLAAGHPVSLDRIETIADGLAPPYARAFNLSLVQRYVDQVVTVTDDLLVEALRLLALKTRLVVEPSGGAAVAAVLHGLHAHSGGPQLAVLSGGNLDPERFAGWLR